MCASPSGPGRESLGPGRVVPTREGPMRGLHLDDLSRLGWGLALGTGSVIASALTLLLEAELDRMHAREPATGADQAQPAVASDDPPADA